jgi:peptidyl-prolyl cis-trans isomerase C
MQMKTIRLSCLFAVLWVSGILVLAGCGLNPAPKLTSSPQLSTNQTQTPPQASASPTIVPSSTATQEPLAALVNGEPITLAEFQSELERYQKAKNSLTSSVSGTNLATQGATEEMIVLQDLIDQTLLAQAAVQAGHPADAALLDERIASLAARTDLQAWLQNNAYTEESFRQALGRALQAAWMRDQIIAEAPKAVEQVHARQILLYNSTEADQISANLQGGADFEQLAIRYDPVSAGDLGWFPKGYLLESALEEAAFSLQPGQFSSVIETRLGFHIIQVIERDSQRPLEAETLRMVQNQTLHNWLVERRAQSEIQVLLQ